MRFLQLKYLIHLNKSDSPDGSGILLLSIQKSKRYSAQPEKFQKQS